MMLAIFSMLMRTTSITLHKTMTMTVHNQYPDIELVSPVYFCNRGTYYEYTVERADGGAAMKTGFRFDPNQDESGGVLMYKVQRKSNTISDHQTSINAIYAKVVEEVSFLMRLLVTWKIKRSGEPKVHIMLIEYGSETALSEDKLAQLYDKVDDIPSVHNPSVWLICNNTALAAKYEVADEKDLELKITISRGVKNKDTMNPMWIDPER
jgi:hypothetical protein